MKKSACILISYALCSCFLTWSSNAFCQPGAIQGNSYISNSYPIGKQQILHQQIENPSGEPGVSSQHDPFDPTLFTQAADDFFVPEGEQWIIDKIVIPGIFSEPDVLLPIHCVLSYFNHVGNPGHPETIPFFEIDLEVNLDADGNLVLFPPPFEFHQGHYWLSVQVVMPFTLGPGKKEMAKNKCIDFLINFLFLTLQHWTVRPFDHKL